MRRDVLGISWLNGRLEVVRARSLRGMDRWQAPGRVEDAAALSGALAEARSKLRWGSTRAVMVYESRSLLFHLQEAPVVQGRLLDQVLGRSVAEQGFFAGPAVWSRVALPGSGGRTRWLLAILPEAEEEAVEEACALNGLELTGLYPMASLLGGWLGAVVAKSGDPVLMATDLGASFSLVVGGGDGGLLFARSLVDTADRVVDRLEQEISRTLHFCQQRFGVGVKRLVALGPPSATGWSERIASKGLEVMPWDPDPEGLGLAALAARLGAQAPFNLARQAGRAPDWLAPTVVAATAALVLAAIGTVVGVEAAVRNRARQVERARQEALVAARQSEERAREQQEGRRLEILTRTVAAPGTTGLPLAFAEYLRSVTPHTMRLIRLELSRSTNGWSVQLDGASREQGSRFLAAVEQWETELTQGAFHLSVTDSTHQRTTTRELSSSAANPARPPRPPAVAADERAFFVTGWIR